MFTAQEPLGIIRAGETTLRLAEDEELLEAAARSGLRYLLVGLKTPSTATLKNASKGFVKPNRAKDLTARLLDHGIIVDSAMLFGFDEHDAGIFSAAFDFVNYAEVDIHEGIIVIPFPGTRRFSNLEKAGRIITRDWARYDGNNVVFKTALMSAAELKKGQEWFYEKRYFLKPFLGRKLRQVKNLGMVSALYLASR